jgi:type I site-specific restriction endonuclease
LKEGNSAFIDENWNAYPDQWGELFRRQRLSKEFMETCIKNWQLVNPFEETVENQDGKGQEQQGWQSQGKQVKERVKPWEQNRQFLAEDVDGKLMVTLSNLIYVDASNLKPRIQNRIRRMAAFANPVFYKNQAMGLSNFANGRYIYLGQDENGYIGIPRGLWEELIEKCEKAEIIWETEDERVRGNEIKVEFNGQLRETQAVAVEKMLAHETGILSAATAFGKTVVCSYLIAARKLSTLVLLESSSLIEQWQEALAKFLMIDEELPEYQTASGQTRKRKSIIGKLQGAHDSMTGIIDIAMAGSLYKKGEFHPKLQEYGMVIVDECHHAASDTVVGILREVKAKYIYGVTATPMRGDGLEKITYRMIGPVRYSYGARDMAKEQGIRHLVYPRFTRTVSPHRLGEQMHVNDAYKLIRDNDMRNEQIAADVKLCIEKGRSPVVLSKYKEHAKLLYERLRQYADRAFLLLGDNPKKEQKKLMEELWGF